MRRPFRAPRIPDSLGQTSPLAMALSTVGAGLQGYSADKSKREEMARLNEAEGYRRKMEKMKQEREREMLEAEKTEKRKEAARARQALRQTAPARLGRTFTDAEAELIAGGQVNPSDLFPNAPTTRPPTAGQMLTQERQRREGLAFLSQNLDNPVFAQTLQLINQDNPDMADDPGLAAFAAMQAFKQQTAAEAAVAEAARRARRGRRPIGNDTTATNAAGQPIMPGTPGIPMYSRQARPQTAQQDSASMARINAAISRLSP
jgi:hypothetical protein